MPIGIAELGVPDLAAAVPSGLVRHRLPDRPARTSTARRSASTSRERSPTRRAASRCTSSLCGLSADGVFLDSGDHVLRAAKGLGHRHRPRLTRPAIVGRRQRSPAGLAARSHAAAMRSRGQGRRTRAHQLRPQRERRDEGTAVLARARAEQQQRMDGVGRRSRSRPAATRRRLRERMADRSRRRRRQGGVAMDAATQRVDRARAVGGRGCCCVSCSPSADRDRSRSRSTIRLRERVTWRTFLQLARPRRTECADRARSRVPSQVWSPPPSSASSAGAVTAVAVGVASRRRRARWWLALGAPGLLALSGLYVLARQAHTKPTAAFEWPAELSAVHQVGWLAVAFLVGLVVVDWIWDRVNRPVVVRSRRTPLLLLLSSVDASVPDDAGVHASVGARRASRPCRSRNAASSSLCEPLLREGAVAQLRALVVHGDTDLRAEPLEQPGSLPRSERRRPCDVEPDLGPGVRSVGVLPTRAAARREPPLELVERDPQRAVDPQHVLHGLVGSHE